MMTAEEAVSVGVKRVLWATEVGLATGAQMLRRQLAVAGDARMQVAVIDGAGAAIARMVANGCPVVMKTLVELLGFVTPAGREALSRAAAPARARRR